MKIKIILLRVALILNENLFAQFVTNKSDIVQLEKIKSGKTPKNVILLIGDGMGLAHIYAAQTVNGSPLYITLMPYTGFVITKSANNYITDSAAGGTALACGVKTNNGMIGVKPDGTRIKNLVEIASEKKMETGLVATSTITHATPASFVSHVTSRKMESEIAKDIVNSDIDLIIGGGFKYFSNRSDSLKLDKDLINKGFGVHNSLSNAKLCTKKKMAVLPFEEAMPVYEKRGDILPDATKYAINFLAKNRRGFFLMTEGSQIDWGAHANKIDYVIKETLDFDRAVGEALKFAQKNRNTLVIVTADHETGGLSLPGIMGEKEANPSGINDNIMFSTKNHTAIPVPLFAYGPGAELFTGVHENTEIFDLINHLIQK